AEATMGATGVGDWAEDPSRRTPTFRGRRGAWVALAFRVDTAATLHADFLGRRDCGQLTGRLHDGAVQEDEAGWRNWRGQGERTRPEDDFGAVDRRVDVLRSGAHRRGRDGDPDLGKAKAEGV